MKDFRMEEKILAALYSGEDLKKKVRKAEKGEIIVQPVYDYLADMADRLRDDASTPDAVLDTAETLKTISMAIRAQKSTAHVYEGLALVSIDGVYYAVEEGF